MKSKNDLTVAGTINSSSEEMTASLSDLNSFQLYASNKPTQSYRPIRDQLPFAPNMSLNSGTCPDRSKHGVSYVRLEDNETLDFNTLQHLHNGFTFVCVLNEWDMQQSNFLLNIRLEADNATLIWSRPAWDINNIWIGTGVNGNSNANGGAGGVASTGATKMVDSELEKATEVTLNKSGMPQVDLKFK